MGIDEDNARERDIRLRPPRASGGPFPLRPQVTITVDRDALNAAFLAAEVAADDEEGEDGPLARFIRQAPFTPTDFPMYGSNNVLLPLVPVKDDPDGDFATVMGGDYASKVREDLARDLDEFSPRHPDPRCKKCGERLGDEDRAEVFNVDLEGPFLVHADPCYAGHKDEWTLA